MVWFGNTAAKVAAKFAATTAATQDTSSARALRRVYSSDDVFSMHSGCLPWPGGRVYRPASDSGENFWRGRWTVLNRPTGFVSLRGDLSRLPHEWLAMGTVVAVRAGSREQIDLQEAFLSLPRSGSLKQSLEDCFLRGLHPEHLEPYLKLARAGVLDLRRPTRVDLSETANASPSGRQRASLLHRMAYAGQGPDRANDQGVRSEEGRSSFTERFRLLRQYGFSLDLRDSLGRAPLHYAVLQNNLPAVRGLIRAGAKIDPRSQEGDTPLILAIKHGSNRCLDYLIRKGANLNAMTTGPSEEETVIDKTEWQSYARICKVVQARVPRPANQEEWAGIHWAASTLGKKATESLQILLDAGCNPNLPTGSGETPLHCATRLRSSPKVSALLLAKANPNLADQNCIRPIHLAAQWGDVEVLSLLLDAGARADKKVCAPMSGDKDMLPIEIALKYRCEKAVRAFYDKGLATPTLEHASQAVLAELYDLVGWYAEKLGNQLGGMLENGNRLVHFAASSSDARMIKQLVLQHHLDINGKSSAGYRAIDMASPQNQTVMMAMGAIV